MIGRNKRAKAKDTNDSFSHISRTGIEQGQLPLHSRIWSQYSMFISAVSIPPQMAVRVDSETMLLLHNAVDYLAKIIKDQEVGFGYVTRLMMLGQKFALSRVSLYLVESVL